MTPLKPIPSGRKVVLGVAFFVLFVAAWSAATFGGFVSKTFLADPVTMLREGWALFTQYGFAGDIAIKRGDIGRNNLHLSLRNALPRRRRSQINLSQFQLRHRCTPGCEGGFC